MMMDRQISVHRAEGVDVQEVTSVLENTNLDDLPPISSRTVRVFLSSTFSDMIQERNALMEHVYPKLKTHCRERHGLEFQMMDLRWGIRDESQDDHTTIDFCLKEIENCKAHSVGPSFVALLGQKYGYRPFPPNIKAAEFESIYNALNQNGKDMQDLDLWYKKDENIVPPMYNLQPISSVLPNFTSKDQKKQDLARQKWEATFDKLRSLMRAGAELCLAEGSVDQRVRDKYFVSVTEYEIYHGMLKCPSAERFALAFYRNVTNIDDHVGQRRGQKFVDINPKTGKVEKEARQLLHTLKTTKLPRCLKKRPGNLCQLDITWKDPVNADPSEDKDYLERLCSKFLTMMVKLIDTAAAHANKMNQDPYVVEVLQHLKMCKTRVEVFRGREGIIQQIRDYVLSDNPEPMVLYGVSGSGKTSIIAKAASQLEYWMPNCKPIKILRFLGTTARSASIRLVLGCMCWQIDFSYGRTDSDLPVDYPGLVNYFFDAIKMATPEQPLIIFLDSLDQLSRSHNAHDLSWLPKNLPPYVRIIVTTLMYEYDILDTLQTDITCVDRFIEVEPLGSQMGIQIINDWLQGSKRKLTCDQFKIVEEALSKCSLPLYARLVYDKVCTWKSYEPIEATQLEFTVKGVINKLFDRVEKYHGKTFVTHVLSYLTASKGGLSDTEIEDILSLDDEVLNDVFTYWMPPIRRIPPLLWPRLQNELHRYIMQRESNGNIVYYWYHRQFVKAIEERYLNSTGHMIYIHSMLAHYYMGTWGNGIKKAFKYTAPQVAQLGLSKKESEADRKVPLQPIEFSQNPTVSKRLRFNIRKLSELPYHLVKCRQITDLKKDVLFNYIWLLKKLQAMSLHDVLSDFRFALDSDLCAEDVEIQILSNALRISGGNIRQRPEALAFELSGRLLPYYGQYPYIRNLLQQCETIALNDSAFLPLFQCFETPKGMLNYILEDHKQNVLDLLFSRSTKHLVSLSKDCTIAFWDLRSGERMRVIDISEFPPEPSSRLHQSKDGKYLCYDSFALNSPICIYDMRNAQLLYKVGKRTHTQRRLWGDGNLLIRQKNIIDITTGKIVRTLDDFINTKTYLTCGIPPNEEYILLGEETKTSMFDFKTGELVKTFAGDNLASIFSITSDSKRVYVGYSEDCKFKIWDLDRSSKSFGQVLLEYDYLKAYPSLKTMVTTVFANELSSISFSPRDENQIIINIKRFQLILLDVKQCRSKMIDMRNVQTGDRTYIAHARFSCDGKFIIAAESHFMHVWEANLEAPKFVASVNIHSIDRFPMALNHENNLIATGSTLHTAIKVWNLDKIYSCSGEQIKVYENPLEMITCSTGQRLVFLKIYHGLASKVGYKFIDYFGIEVWNMSTGSHSTCLPIGRYGQLLQMEASQDGQMMALLVSNRDESYVVLISFKLNKILHTFPHAGATKMVVSPGWDFIATEGVVEGTHDIKLWSSKNALLERFMWASNPIFTLDNANLMYILNHNCVEVFSLKTMCGVNSIICDSDEIDVIPTLPQMVIVTKVSSKQWSPLPPRLIPGNVRVAEAQVSLWHITAGLMISQFTHVAPGGIKDISKDGRLCIDGYLQVFEVKTGKLLIDLGLKENPRPEFKKVCLTYDGQYAIWVDDLYVKAARIKSGTVIACICTHEQPVSLQTLDFGYIVVIGREDGHIMTAKLVDGDNKVPHGFCPTDGKERTQWLMEKLLYPDGIIATFDPFYQAKPSKVADTHMPHFIKEMQTVLQDKAKVLHAVIKTSSYDNLRDLDKDKKRRGSSPIAHLFDGRSRSKETSPVSSGCNSPATLPRRNRKYCKSPSADVIGGTTRQRTRDRSPSLHDLFSTQKALQNTGSILMALTDMTPVGKLFKRKSSQNDVGSPPSGSPFPARRFSTEPNEGMRVGDNSLGGTSNTPPTGRSPVQSISEEAKDYRREVGRSRFYSSSEYPQISHL